MELNASKLPGDSTCNLQNIPAGPGACFAMVPNLIITELFYLVFLNMYRSSLHTRSVRRIHLFLDKDELKIALQTRKVSRAFEKQA